MEKLYSLEILQNIAEYNQLIACLLDDQNGVRARKLEMDNKGVSKIVHGMIFLWLAGEDQRHPPTWSRLVKCFRYAKQHNLGNKIENDYCDEVKNVTTSEQRQDNTIVYMEHSEVSWDSNVFIAVSTIVLGSITVGLSVGEILKHNAISSQSNVKLKVIITT